jgi:hypothetical protein
MDRNAVQTDLQKPLERTYTIGGKKLKVNLVTVKAWKSGSPGGDDDESRAIVYDEPCRNPEAGSDKLVESISTIVNNICLKMESTARKMDTGITRFMVQLRVPGSDKVVHSEPYALYSDEGSNHYDLDRGIPGGEMGGTERGERRYELRHREVMYQFNVRQIEERSKDDREEMMRLRTALASRDAQISRMQAVVEQAHSQAVLRDTLIKSAAQKDAMLQQLFGTLLANLHIIVQYFSGGSGATINLGESQEIQAVKKMYFALDPELKGEFDIAMTRLVAKLPAAQQHVALKVVESVRSSEMNERLKEIEQIGSSKPSMKSLNG